METIKCEGGVAHSDESTENSESAAPLGFWKLYCECHLIVLFVHSNFSNSTGFSCRRQLFSVHDQLSNQQQFLLWVFFCPSLIAGSFIFRVWSYMCEIRESCEQIHIFASAGFQLSWTLLWIWAPQAMATPRICPCVTYSRCSRYISRLCIDFVWNHTMWKILFAFRLNTLLATSSWT